MAYKPSNPNGQATMADSEPVVIASDQSAVPVSASGLPLPTGAATSAKQDTGNTSLSSVDTKLTDNSQKTQIVDGSGNAVTVTGNKLDVNATASLAGETLPIAAATEAVGVAVVDDAGNQITDFATQTTLASADANLNSISSDTSSIATAIPGLLQESTFTPVVSSSGTPASGTSIQISGVDGSGDAQPIATNASGHVSINDGGNTITVDGAVTVTNATAANLKAEVVGATTGSGTATGAMRVELPTNGTGVIATVGAVTAITNALPAGTNAIGKLAANSGVDIGDVDVTTVTPGSGATNLGAAVDSAASATKTGVLAVGIRDDALSTLTPVDGDYVEGLRVDSRGALWTTLATALSSSTDTVGTDGTIAHDAADSGNPVKIGLKAYSPDGTTPGTAVAEGDRTDAKSDLDGRQYINDEHPRYWSYHADGSTALTDASVAADPGDGFQIVITDIIFSNGAATAINMFLEEGSTKILGPIYLEAINGRGFVWKGKKHVTASTAVTVTTSSSTAHAVDILGYIQAV
jgi:hypothetical protein